LPGLEGVTGRGLSVATMRVKRSSRDGERFVKNSSRFLSQKSPMRGRKNDDYITSARSAERDPSAAPIVVRTLFDHEFL
jgi:hypothetical protein